MSDALRARRMNLERVVKLLREEGFPIYAELIQGEVDHVAKLEKRNAKWRARNAKADH